MTNKELVKKEWYVFLIDNGNVIKYNIYNNLRFQEQIGKLAKNFTEYNEDFKEELNRSIMYCFWGKFEYEMIITELFTSITSGELERLKGIEDCKYRTSVNLEIGSQIDVYEQLLMNYDVFSKYVFDNLNRKTKRRTKNE